MVIKYEKNSEQINLDSKFDREKCNELGWIDVKFKTQLDKNQSSSNHQAMLRLVQSGVKDLISN